jgi:hypothetical protein
MNKNNLIQWLEQECSDGLLNKHSLIKNHYGNNYHMSVYNKYYNDNDIDIQLSSKENEKKYVDFELDDLDNSVCDVMEVYEDDYENTKIISHAPNSNIQQTSYLFKRLLDAVDKYNLSVNVPTISANGKVIKYVTMPIIDKSAKQNFYLFCKENTF